eukprot:TRINITY_DN9015_c0_g1_i1.p1 TRINITY_DN9015_c0_g1~~TRINITY_DN9015_c0_g1_i1.p1  ORF type:complete len:283 (-),score=61.17 TRINITY_DN9015_c0_g1_i1:94-942(-)
MTHEILYEVGCAVLQCATALQNRQTHGLDFHPPAVALDALRSVQLLVEMLATRALAPARRWRLLLILELCKTVIILFTHKQRILRLGRRLVGAGPSDADSGAPSKGKRTGVKIPAVRRVEHPPRILEPGASHPQEPPLDRLEVAADCVAAFRGPLYVGLVLRSPDREHASSPCWRPSSSISPSASSTSAAAPPPLPDFPSLAAHPPEVPPPPSDPPPAADPVTRRRTAYMALLHYVERVDAFRSILLRVRAIALRIPGFGNVVAAAIDYWLHMQRYHFFSFP